MTDIPAGWYDDPEHPAQYRYWDGSQWTDHRSPKAHGGGAVTESGVWDVLSESFRLLGRGWRELVVLALPLVLLTIGAGLLALSSLDSALDPGIGDIIDRVTEPGFDPVNDADDEAFVESIDVSLTAGAIVGFGVAAILFLVGGTVVSLSFTVFLAALRRGRALGLGEIYGITLGRLPRFIGILLLWTLVASTVVFAALVVVAVAILITPWLLLLIGPLSIAAIIYLWPYGALAVTTLSVAPTDDPPFRRTVALIKPNWPFVALRLLVLTVVFAIISFGGSAVTTPFSAASVWAGFLVSMILRAVGSVMTTAGNVVLYDVAGGPFDPGLEITSEGEMASE